MSVVTVPFLVEIQLVEGKKFHSFWSLSQSGRQVQLEHHKSVKRFIKFAKGDKKCVKTVGRLVDLEGQHVRDIIYYKWLEMS